MSDLGNLVRELVPGGVSVIARGSVLYVGGGAASAQWPAAVNGKGFCGVLRRHLGCPHDDPMGPCGKCDGLAFEVATGRSLWPWWAVRVVVLASERLGCPTVTLSGVPPHPCSADVGGRLVVTATAPVGAPVVRLGVARDGPASGQRPR